MAQDKITEIFDIDAIKANKTAALNEIRGSVKELQDIQSAIKSSTSIAGSSENSDKASKATKELTASLKEYIAQNERLIVAQAKLAQSTSDDAKALAVYKVELSNTNKQLKEEAVLVSGLTGAYDKLNVQHKQAIKAYQDAAAEQRLSSQEIIRLKDNANKLGDQLVKIDSAIGNYRRNVGNYSSQWNGLGNAINQVGRELPNFAQSMQLGFLAISNNLPILSDEIANARQRIAELKAEGKDAPSLFNQIAKSIFSWQTLMVVGITILTKYGAEITDIITKLVSGTTDAAKAQEILNKTYKDPAIIDAIANVNRLGTDIELAKTKTIDKTRVLKEYNDTIGKVAGEVKNWNDLEQAYIDNSDKYIRFTLLRAASNYAFEESAKKSVDALLETQKTLQNAAKINPANTNPLAMARTLFSGITAQNAKEESDQLLKIAQDFRQQAAAIYDVNDPIKAKKEKRKKDAKSLAEDTIDIYTQITNKLNDFEEDERQVRSRSLAYLRTQLEAGVISVSQYEKQKQDIIKSSERDILVNQTKFLAKTLSNYGFSQENTSKILELWQNKRISLIQKETDSEEAELKVRVQHRKRFDEINANNLKEKIAEEKKLEREKYRYIQQIAQETTAFIFTLLDAQNKKELAELDKRKERLSEEYDLKTSAVERAAISEEERAARKQVLDAEEKQRQKEIDKEIREIKRKQAIFDKAQAIATIAINTAVAVSSPTNLALGGTLTPFILGLGAAQAAIVLATPLPEYAKGKKESDSYEGFAIAGEKGTEMRIDKDGSLQILEKPTLIYTKRGDTILSNEQLKKGAAEKYLGEGSKVDNSELIRALGYNIGMLRKDIKSQPSNVIIDNTPYHLNIKRARA